LAQELLATPADSSANFGPTVFRVELDFCAK
jgi:hypothetical protein